MITGTTVTAGAISDLKRFSGGVLIMVGGGGGLGWVWSVCGVVCVCVGGGGGGILGPW